MSAVGYYQYPTIHGDRLVCVSEDDLWTASVDGGIARRLTANQDEASRPVLSPDGKLVAFSAREEGETEVYVMPSDGGPLQRLTFLGAMICQVVGWHPETGEVVFCSSAGQPFRSMQKLFAVSAEGGLPRELPCGRANSISFGPDGKSVVARHSFRPPQHRKRYRGGTCGHLWIDANGSGEYRRLAAPDGNVSCPMWIGERIYFLSDHEGVGNLYSCIVAGGDVKRHSEHEDFFACNASTDGSRIVYQAGAELFVFDTASEQVRKVEITLQSPRMQRSRRFVSSAKFLESFRPDSGGRSIAIVSRGKVFSADNWDGPVQQFGEPNGVRYRLAAWLNDGERIDGERIVAVNDQAGDESLCVFAPNEGARQIDSGQFGRAVELAVSPTDDRVLLHNHRGELVLVDLEDGKTTVLDHSRHGRIDGICWSPDGRWVAYAMPVGTDVSIVKLCELASGETHAVTRPVLRDIAPSFDPDGRYLYFLSHRVFDPVYDNVHFELSFPRSMRPYLVTLQSDTPSPFVGQVSKLPEPTDEERHDARPSHEIQIDHQGIEDRVVPFPVDEGIYGQIRGASGGKVFFTSFPVEGSLRREHLNFGPPSTGVLQRYDLSDRTAETWAENISTFEIAAAGKKLVYRTKDRLRVIDVAEKPNSDSEKEAAGRKNGWLDLERFKVSVNPPDEWRQMFHEAWRLVRDHFWREDMSGVNWQQVRERYEPLLDRIASRSEFADLIWEMQGELGTSHAYVMGGDARQAPQYKQGHLGADFEYDDQHDRYRVKHMVRGDSWDEHRGSPLQAPGVNVQPGDQLLAINGQPLNGNASPHQLLVNQAGTEVSLTLSREGQPPRNVVVKTLKDEQPLRYRQWVETNRDYVHQVTSNSIGYVHVPNMIAEGYAEFHRYWLLESEHDGLIVDVRFNSGGHVSQLLLEKLMRRRWGYCVGRWNEPRPHPVASSAGPLVAVTNECAGSDGDIFSHCFKLAGLGPLIGKRTWGGTIGIHPRHSLVDGGLTTQPEFAFWFNDVGWGVENYGTDPDIDVDSPPHEEALGKDIQLDRAIEEVNRLLEAHPPQRPEFE